jgi:hypothetical protein
VAAVGALGRGVPGEQADRGIHADEPLHQAQVPPIGWRTRTTAPGAEPAPKGAAASTRPPARHEWGASPPPRDRAGAGLEPGQAVPEPVDQLAVYHTTSRFFVFQKIWWISSMAPGVGRGLLVDAHRRPRRARPSEDLAGSGYRPGAWA